MSSVQQTAQRAWTLPPAVSNITNPLAVALALYPIQEVRHTSVSLSIYAPY